MKKQLRPERHCAIESLLVILAGVLTNPGIAQNVTVGKGSYTTSKPAGLFTPSNTDKEPVMPRVTPAFRQVPPTNTWWSSAIWPRYKNTQYSENIYAHPLALKTFEKGVYVSYPDKPIISQDGTTYSYPFEKDLSIGLTSFTNAKCGVDAYSDWTVTFASQQGTDTLRTTIGHGFLFLYFEKRGDSDVLISPHGEDSVWYNDGGTLGITINGHLYGLFAPSNSKWEISTDLRSDLAGKEYFSVALLPSPNEIKLFAECAHTHITSTTVSWKFDENTSRLVTTFQLSNKQYEENQREPFIALYQHQWRHCVSSIFEPFSYQSSRGQMKVLSTSSFTTSMKFQGVLPILPGLAKIDTTLYRSDFNKYTSVSDPFAGLRDTYWAGKELGKIASLCALADQLKQYGARDSLVGKLKTELENWFTAEGITNDKQIFYENLWCSFIGSPASYGSDSELNDHHFHYGYFVRAAAIVAQIDHVWANQANWGGMVELLVSDVAGAAVDRPERLPRFRNFDPYAGHSWAAGHGGFAAGNNQESSSEAINFATGCILWGQAVGNKQIRDLGILLYTTEVESAKLYWFDPDRTTFPEAFGHTTLGILWGNGGAYATWWTANPEEIHGINWLPIHGGSAYLGFSTAYTERNLNELRRMNGGAESEWRDIIWSFQAISFPDSSIRMLQAAGNYTPEAGSSCGITDHWIRNLSVLGQPDSSKTADICTFLTFRKNDSTRICIVNTTNTVKQIKLSDGTSFSLLAGQWLVISDNINTRINANYHSQTRPGYHGVTRLYMGEQIRFPDPFAERNPIDMLGRKLSIVAPAHRMEVLHDRRK